MKEKRIQQLTNELKYLLDVEIQKEIIENDLKLSDETISIKEVAKEIYLKRGINISRIKKGIGNSLIDTITEMASLFKNKDKSVKNKMIMEVVYIIVLLILMKIPFDLVRDIGYEYIELMTTSTVVYTLWNLAFLLIYTITLICAFIVFIRNFNNKYRDAK